MFAVLAVAKNSVSSHSETVARRSRVLTLHINFSPCWRLRAFHSPPPTPKVTIDINEEIKRQNSMINDLVGVCGTEGCTNLHS